MKIKYSPMFTTLTRNEYCLYQLPDWRATEYLLGLILSFVVKTVAKKMVM